jgi:hypothetical protein
VVTLPTTQKQAQLHKANPEEAIENLREATELYLEEFPLVFS